MMATEHYIRKSKCTTTTLLINRDVELSTLPTTSLRLLVSHSPQLYISFPLLHYSIFLMVSSLQGTPSTCHCNWFRSDIIRYNSNISITTWYYESSWRRACIEWGLCYNGCHFTNRYKNNVSTCMVSVSLCLIEIVSLAKLKVFYIIFLSVKRNKEESNLFPKHLMPRS